MPRVGCDMSIWPLEKCCTACEETQPLEQFAYDKKGKFNRKQRCKECDKVYRSANVEDIAARRKAWWVANPEYRAQYDKDNAEAITKRVRQYRDLNREHINEYQRTYAMANPGKGPEKQRRFRQNHPEYTLDPNRKAAHHKRRAILLGLTEHHTAQEWVDLCEFYNYTCLCCGVAKGELDRNGKVAIMTPDHIVPLSKGGSNTIDNLQPLCGSCNSRKLAKTIDYRPKNITTEEETS